MSEIGAWTRHAMVGVLLAGAACDGGMPLSREALGTHPPLAATSADGMVVSGSTYATAVGARILAEGGNAVDAAVATAFALAVTEPTQSGLGGRTQALVWSPDGSDAERAGLDGRAFGVDATTGVPASYDPETAPLVDDGYEVVGIPGTVAGLAIVHERAGSMPWPEVIQPAIDLAEAGFELSVGEARRIESVRERLVRSEGARAAFLRDDGSPYPPGETFRQPDLARTLRTLAEEGAASFYVGGLAERMAADVQAGGGFLTTGDLRAYEAEPSIVVQGRFGGTELVGTYLPASGATTIEALQILDRVALAEMGPGERAFAVGRALLMAFEDRETAWNDERAPEEDARWITSAALADERAAQLGVASPVAAEVVEEPEPAHTTHLSVVDSDGMAVAMTQSLGPTGGSAVVTPGLGFLYAATLGGYLGYVEPGDRPWSSQSPLVALRGDRPAYVLGGAGARRIISALVETIVRMEVDGLGTSEALAAPRFHPAPSTWRFERLVEDGPEPPGADRAREGGYTVLVEPSGTYFARLNVIAIDPEGGTMTGVADPRWPWGAASGPGRYDR